MRAYLICLSETTADLLDAAEKSPETIELGPLPEAAKAEARQLYYILALQCSGSALQVVKGVEKNNGFEAWRRMFQRHEPAAGGRHLSMMSKIMEPVFPSNTEGWEEALTTWENDVRRWEISAEETLSSSIKPAIHNKNAPGDIRMHLKHQNGVLTNYESTRNAILFYVLSSQTLHGIDATTDMEVGAVLWKGKGRGKKGKDKNGEKESQVCFTCGKPGHLSTECLFKDNSTEGGRSKG